MLSLLVRINKSDQRSGLIDQRRLYFALNIENKICCMYMEGNQISPKFPSTLSRYHVV